MFRRNWFGGAVWKPKNPHSLEHLKYLHNVLAKNQIVIEQNKSLLVETLRAIAEILIWGDQNDSSVFDFFLERNMLSFFLKIMKQKCGSYVCVQLLQTLNILFENIRNETSLYYLLSNNHVNSIIVHKFDFSDEEVMAYYISFLKTLSLKLNKHTIHFFYNEQHTDDFPLYTEAIKFFNHSESMVRIAVRTLTLNVYKVGDQSMLMFIRNRTAAPYFSNLVWFIGNHVLELDTCVRHDADHQSRGRLSDLVAEHLDHLHYLNDILCLEIAALNEVLVDHLLNRLLIPLYVYSLTKRRRHSQLEDSKPHISSVVSLFLLSQVFLIITHKPLVQTLAQIILNKDMSIFLDGGTSSSGSDNHNSSGKNSPPMFMAPLETLEQSLDEEIHRNEEAEVATESSWHSKGISSHSRSDASTNITDEEKERLASQDSHDGVTVEQRDEGGEFSLVNRPFLEAVFTALEVSENDYSALFALCLLYALSHNKGKSSSKGEAVIKKHGFTHYSGIDSELLESALIPSRNSDVRHRYNIHLVERLLHILTCASEGNSKVRLATLELSIILLRRLVKGNSGSYLQDEHLAAIEGAKEEAVLTLRNFYKSEEIFLDMFEDEYVEMERKPLNVEYLMMDASLLLPPTGTPFTGIEFYKRLPCGEVERARRAIRVFFLLRGLSLCLRDEPEVELPLTDPQTCIQVDETLDLNNSDLISCTVMLKDGTKLRRFLVIDVLQIILVEPDTKKLGWGVAKFVGFLQDVEASGDKEDSRCLHITIHRPASSSVPNRVPLLSARFIFDDHIRCMAAKQRLTKGRMKARQRKVVQIARLLDLPGSAYSSSSSSLITATEHGFARRVLHRSNAHDGCKRDPHSPMGARAKVPGFAAKLKRPLAHDSLLLGARPLDVSAPSLDQPGSSEKSAGECLLSDIPVVNMSQMRPRIQHFQAPSSVERDLRNASPPHQYETSLDAHYSESDSPDIPTDETSFINQHDDISDPSHEGPEKNSFGQGTRRKAKGEIETV
ncbi:unnamed protein product [Darwinula stevensoni]|uniref:Protein CLEC16A n=1 Tax=Darwinula stevensoni TaxID=69355 RepID=A0A7R8WYZ8_9CRUS|nr:unnamed protein product [Darwinula stevensoni]CAG0879516.1 unnamed protein product [Darwinula stevensoni]